MILKALNLNKISELESMISNEVIEKLDDIDQKLSYSLKTNTKRRRKKMFKVYFPFQWLVKGILLVLLGLILLEVI